jgi:hypothetical protein
VYVHLCRPPGDEETAVADLTLSASSSDTVLVPDANIVLGGSGANRTVTVTPASNQSGSATITLTVSDGTASTSDTFVLTVGAASGSGSTIRIVGYEREPFGFEFESHKWAATTWWKRLVI